MMKKFYYLVLIFCFLLSILIAKNTGFILPQQLLGLALILVLPGYVVYKKLLADLPIAKPYNYFLFLPLSIGIFSFGLLLLSKIIFEYTNFNVILLTLAVSILMAILDFVFPDKKSAEEKSGSIIPIIVIFALATIIWVTYKFFPGDDTYILAGTIRQSIRSGNVVQVALERRPLFTPFAILLHYAAGSSVFAMLKYIIPAISFSALFPAIGLLASKFNKGWIFYGLSLILLASPYMIFTLSYAIPQSMLLTLLIPTFILSYYGLKKDRFDLLATSLALAFAATGYHELSFTLLFATLIAVLVFIIRSAKKMGGKIVSGLILALIVLLPYAIIFQISEKLSSFFSVLSYASAGSNNHFLPRIWYVNYYTNPDNIIFSYPGTSGLIWYAYLGATVLFVGIAFLLIFLKIKRNKINLLNYVHLILFTLLFFSIAEIYPRLFSIAFLPERAWVFMVISLWMLLVLLFSDNDLNPEKSKAMKYCTVIAILAIIAGTGAATYLNLNRSIMMSDGDQKSVDFVRNKSEENAVFISTQVHQTGPVSVAERSFISVNPPKEKVAFEVFRAKALSDYNEMINSYQAEKDEVIYGLDGRELSVKKIKLIRNPDEIKNAPVYFIYSLERFNNTKFVGNPNYFKQNDEANKDLYFSEEYLGQAFYNDGKVVIFRLK